MNKVWMGAWLLVVAGSPAVGQTNGEGPIEVPLRVSGGRLLVPVEAPDGTKLEFALSTGTRVTVLSQSAAARLGDHWELTVGGAPVDNEDSRTLPDADLTTDGVLVDGMIGSNTLNQFDVLVDVPRGRLVLKPIGRSVVWEGRTMSDPVRLRVHHGVMLGLDVELNGRAFKAMLDLGTPAVLASDAAKAAMQLDDDGVGTLVLGASSFPDLQVHGLDLDTRMWDPNNDGFVVVGAPVAYDCAISISWVHREMRTCVR